jgi:segregation and condensation protein A
MTDSEIPLDITGHEDRESPRDSDPASGDQPRERESPRDSDPASGNQPRERESPRDSDPASGDTGEAGADETTTRTDEDEVEPVEVLVQLAEDGEIDPWDIDIVAVTDKFLDRLDEADLRTSGRALFYASVLLRMKGDAMLADDEPDPEPEPEPWETGVGIGTGAKPMDDEPVDGPDPFAALESEMDRRLERKRARGTPQTLDELVRDLREAERDSWWKESREYDTSDSPTGYSRGTRELDYRAADDLRMDDEPTAGDVTGTTHAENIDEVIESVHAALREQYEQGREEVLYREVADAGGSRVQTFLGLLFLSHRGQVRLQQDDLFGDLWIQDPAATGGSGEVAAD